MTRQPLLFPQDTFCFEIIPHWAVHEGGSGCIDFFFFLFVFSDLYCLFTPLFFSLTPPLLSAPLLSLTQTTFFFFATVIKYGLCTRLVIFHQPRRASSRHQIGGGKSCLARHLCFCENQWIRAEHRLRQLLRIPCFS